VQATTAEVRTPRGPCHAPRTPIAPAGIASPDVGRAKLANRIAERLDAAPAVIAKRRTGPGRAAATLLIGEARGRGVVLVDDMIDTGATLIAAARTLRDAGAVRIMAMATHGIFSGDALERLGAAGFDEVVVTNTVPVPEPRPSWLTVLPVDGILAASIDAVFRDASVSALFEGGNQLF
jgi:ribose-phosphate pyrophosphokinase